MEVLKTVRRFPFISYGVAALLADLLIMVLWSFGEGYDDGGVGLLAFILKLVWTYLAFPFHLALLLLVFLNDSKAFWGSEAVLQFVAYVLGFLVLGAAELLWQRRRARRT